MDVRGRDLFRELPEVMRALRDGRPCAWCSSMRPTRCSSAASRPCAGPHPLQGDGTILDGIRLERESRSPAVRESADIIIDTSAYNIHQLATQVTDLFAAAGAARHILTVMSFGFKYGLPPDADMVADMRFLPNPFWNEDLRALNGEDDDVRDFVLEQEGAREFLDSYAAALVPVIAGYQRENKRHSVVAIGCTGGKHRSVVDRARAGRAAIHTPRSRGSSEASRPRSRVGLTLVPTTGLHRRRAARCAPDSRGDPWR